MSFVLPRRWIGIAASVLCLTAFSIWLVLQLSQGDLDRGDKLASIVSMSVAVVTLPLSLFAIVVTLRQSQPTRAVLTLAERLDEMAEALAISVRSQWEAEEQIRRIHDPFPLPTRWTAAPEHLMDHWQIIHGAPDPLDLDGHGDHIVDTFNRIPSGRLVVLGRAGAGKTVLTSRFVLTLLAVRPVPVPVIFTLGSWDTSASPLRDWLTDQLISNYPFLAERDSSGATVAAQLLTTGRILPVLDGFDEISEGLRVDAIEAINAGLRPDDRMLLTSRIEEYAAAVRQGDVLTAAAVVRLEDLTVTDIAGYLPLTTRKVNSGRNKWEPVFEHLHSGPSLVVEVLSTPLMVALARTIFSDTGADPAELLSATSAADLEEYLLAGFVPAVYPNGGDPSRWLGFLAAHLRRLDTYDLTWWQLVLTVPRVVIGLLSGMGITLVVWLMIGTPVWLSRMPDDVRGAWLPAWLAAGPLAGAVGGLAHGHFRGLRPPPGRPYRMIPRGFGPISRWLGRGMRRWQNLVWLAICAVGGSLFGWMVGAISRSATGMMFGVGVGAVVGVAAYLTALFVLILGAWVDPSSTVSPDELQRADRTMVLRAGLTFGIGMSTMLWLVVWLSFEHASGMPFRVVYGDGLWVFNWLIVAAGGALAWILFSTAYGLWLIARFWLVLTGRLPRSVMAFLADAHRRGVLRQAGGVYQFRHARLRDRLATR